MEVILVDLVSDSNQVDGCIADEATLHSLSDLVSSDDSTILSSDRQNEIQSADHYDEHRRRRHVSRMSGTEISIIACSSPEIKALVQPAVPPSIQCRHQRSVSTLSIFPDDDDTDLFCDTNNTVTTKMKRDRHPVVSPDHEHLNRNMKPNDFRLSIEHRDQESCHSEGRFIYDNEPTPVASNTSHKGAVDQLAVRLERQRIKPPRIYSSAEVPNKDVRDSSHPNNNNDTANNTHQKRHPVRRRSSMHRRVSYDNLPDLSEIYCHPDLQSTNET